MRSKSKFKYQFMEQAYNVAVFWTMCFTVSRCCPPASFLAPCNCSGPSNFPILQCSNLADRGQLERVFRGPYNYYALNYGKFSLTNSRIDTLEPETFGQARFDYIHIRKTTLSMIRDRALDSSKDTVKRIEITHCELKNFPFQNVSAYSKLEILQLSYNSIKTIPDYAFKYNPRLKKIDLSFNKINYIGTYAIYYVPHLEELNLKYNRLKVLNNHAFAVHHKPNDNFVLDLSNNQILLISDGAFENQMFGTLNMTNNRLKTMPEKHFFPILQKLGTKLKGVIDVEGNRMSCTCNETKWLLRMPVYYRRFVHGFKCEQTQRYLEHLTTYDIGCNA